jgi:hypothetical protein
MEVTKGRFQVPQQREKRKHCFLFSFAELGIEREGVGEREFPVEEGSESSSVGKP